MLLKKRLLMVSLLLLPVLGCGSGEEAGNPDVQSTVKVTAAVAQETVSPVTYEAAGTIQAKSAGTLAAKLMGTVTAVHVKEGDVVKKGDLLVSIDDRQVSAQLAQARAAVAQAKQGAAAAAAAEEAARAGAELASSTFARYKKLRTDESVSKQEYDEVAARYRQARSALKQAKEMAAAAGSQMHQAESGLSSAKAAHQDASVRAPFDGRVGAKYIEAGDMAAPGSPLIAIEGVTGFEMAVNLPEMLFQSVQAGQEVTVRISAMNDLSLTGTIAALSPAADAQSRSFLVKVALPENGQVRAGMFARARVKTGEEILILVPQSAVLHQGHLTGVFLLDEDNTARFRLVRIGRNYGGQVEVISGLAKGARFVTEPPATLLDGMHVEAAL